MGRSALSLLARFHCSECQIHSYCFSQAAIKMIFRDARFSETSSRTDAPGFNRRIKESYESDLEERNKNLCFI